MRKPITLLGIFLLVFTLDALARDVAGVAIPDRATLADGSQLTLNGAGVRKKFFVKVYAGALYVAEPRRDAAKIIADPGAKRMLMHFIYKEVSQEKQADGWTSGFKKNTNDPEFDALKARLDKFNNLLVTVKQNDVIRLDYLPRAGTQIWFNGELRGTIEGEDFHRTLLKVWIGESPADSGFKKSLLGGS